MKSVQIGGTTRYGITTRENTLPMLKSYTVVEGDSLSSIAKSQYGDSTRWRDIYEKNKNVITNPNKIHVGDRLVMMDK